MEVTKEMRRAAVLMKEILEHVTGEEGATGMTALTYSLVSVAKSIGVSKEKVINAIDAAWDDPRTPVGKPSG